MVINLPYSRSITVPTVYSNSGILAHHKPPTIVTWTDLIQPLVRALYLALVRARSVLALVRAR